MLASMRTLFPKMQKKIGMWGKWSLDRKIAEYTFKD